MRQLLDAFIDRKLVSHITGKHILRARSVAVNQLGELSELTCSERYMGPGLRPHGLAFRWLRRTYAGTWARPGCGGRDSGRLS